MNKSLESLGDGTRIAARAKLWQLRNRCLSFSDGPAIMGIVNVTPDSFSDGGRYFTPDLAIDHALRLEDAGAAILDVGGESTRPYSQPVSEEQELRRVLPVIEALGQRSSIPISIDTSKSRVAQAAIELGAEVVNDVTGVLGDPQMAEVIARTGAGVCVMHMQGDPQTMQDNPRYQDVINDVFHFLQNRCTRLESQGILKERICLDPGIGFGKTHEHNLLLLQNAGKFLELRQPILVGHSRKGFIGKLLGSKDGCRDAGTLGISLALAIKGIQLLRVHDVASTKDALIAMRACLE